MKSPEKIMMLKKELSSVHPHVQSDLVIRPSLPLDNEHFQECIRLHSQNMISETNAFSLKLIDVVLDLLNNGMFKNFDLAVPSLAAGTSIYAARVDRIHRSTREVMAKLSVAKVTEESSPPPRITPRDSNNRSSPNISITGRQKIVPNSCMSRIRNQPPKDDIIFRHEVNDFDSCALDRFCLNRLEGFEYPIEDKCLLTTLDRCYVNPLVHVDLDICSNIELREFVFLHDNNCSRVVVNMASPNVLQVKGTSPIKQEVKEEVYSAESDCEEKMDTSWLQPLSTPINCLKEIRCGTVEQYVELLRRNIDAQVLVNGELGDQFFGELNSRRSSNRKRTIMDYEGLMSNSALGKKRRVCKRRKRRILPAVPQTKFIKEELVSTNTDPTSLPLVIKSQPYELPENFATDLDDEVVAELDSVEDQGECHSRIVEEFESIEGQCECQSRIASLSIPHQHQNDFCNVRELIQCIRMILNCKSECHCPDGLQFSELMKRVRAIRPYNSLGPAVVLFSLLHVSESENLCLESDSFLKNIQVLRT